MGPPLVLGPARGPKYVAQSVGLDWGPRPVRTRCTCGPEHRHAHTIWSRTDINHSSPPHDTCRIIFCGGLTPMHELGDPGPHAAKQAGGALQCGTGSCCNLPALRSPSRAARAATGQLSAARRAHSQAERTEHSRREPQLTVPQGRTANQRAQPRTGRRTSYMHTRDPNDKATAIAPGSFFLWAQCVQRRPRTSCGQPLPRTWRQVAEETECPDTQHAVATVSSAASGGAWSAVGASQPSSL